MKLVFASDSFKGSLSSGQICSLLERAAAEVLPSAECVPLLMADGGEGTLDAIESVHPCERLHLYVNDSFMNGVRRTILIHDDEAFIEAASTCGLAMVGKDKLNPLATTSFGVGECVSHALWHDCKRIAIGLGGTCTNDGGMGCLRALGVRFFDDEGRELAGSGADLGRVALIDESGLYPRVREASFTILSDVTNPLLGPNGATHVFGKQKGADDRTLELLEAGMRHFSDVVRLSHPEADFNTPGYGAAGGLGMALSVFLGAQMSSGIETILQSAGIDDVLADADLVVTGEGQLDGQSLQGKVVSGVVTHARRAGVPIAVICGRAALDDDQLNALGFAHVVETSASAGLDYALAHAEETYLNAARTLFRALA